MVELLSRPRFFVLALWVTSMFVSCLLGGLLLDFDAGTVKIWILLTLLGPALVWLMLLVQQKGTGSGGKRARPKTHASY
jgi:hypothetical protein